MQLRDGRAAVRHGRDRAAAVGLGDELLEVSPAGGGHCVRAIARVIAGRPMTPMSMTIGVWPRSESGP